MTNLIWFLIIGAIAGWLAGLLMKGRGFGILGDIVVGIVGAVLGGWLFGALGISAGGGLAGSLIVAFIGAVILLFLVRLIKRAGAIDRSGSRGTAYRLVHDDNRNAPSARHGRTSASRRDADVREESVPFHRGTALHARPHLPLARSRTKNRDRGWPRGRGSVHRSEGDHARGRDAAAR